MNKPVRRGGEAKLQRFVFLPQTCPPGRRRKGHKEIFFVYYYYDVYLTIKNLYFKILWMFHFRRFNFLTFNFPTFLREGLQWKTFLFRLCEVRSNQTEQKVWERKARLFAEKKRPRRCEFSLFSVKRHAQI